MKILFVSSEKISNNFSNAPYNADEQETYNIVFQYIKHKQTYQARSIPKDRTCQTDYCANNKIHSRNIPPPLRPKIPAGGLTPCRRPGFAPTDNRACPMSETTTPTAVTRKTALLRQHIRQRRIIRIPRAKPGQQPPFPYIIIGKHRQTPVSGGRERTYVPTIKTIKQRQIQLFRAKKS